MTEPRRVERERLEVIACYALWQLRDLDPARESAALRAARLELRRRMPDRGGGGPRPGPGAPRHLRLVR